MCLFGGEVFQNPEKASGIPHLLIGAKVRAAAKAGCRRFDGALKGFGGCPMAKDVLTGNMPTEKLVSYFTAKKEITNISAMSFESAYNEATKIFGAFH